MIALARFFSRFFSSFAAAQLIIFGLPAWAEPFKIVALPETKVLAVAPSPGVPGAFAVAFGKLVGYYARPQSDFKVVFPQMSLTLGTKNYAAIGYTGVAKGENDVEVFSLPACNFVTLTYVGNYGGISPAVKALIEKAKAQHLAIRDGCGIRILHRNSPDDTPADKLIHDIYVPVQPQP